MSGMIVDLIIFVGGMLAMGFITFNEYINAWEEGYKAAERIYNNWDIGFKQGFQAGAQYVIDKKEVENETT